MPITVQHSPDLRLLGQALQAGAFGQFDQRAIGQNLNIAQFMEQQRQFNAGINERRRARQFQAEQSRLSDLRRFGLGEIGAQQDFQRRLDLADAEQQAGLERLETRFDLNRQLAEREAELEAQQREEEVQRQQRQQFISENFEETLSPRQQERITAHQDKITSLDDRVEQGLLTPEDAQVRRQEHTDAIDRIIENRQLRPRRKPRHPLGVTGGSLFFLDSNTMRPLGDLQQGNALVDPTNGSPIPFTVDPESGEPKVVQGFPAGKGSAQADQGPSLFELQREVNRLAVDLQRAAGTDVRGRPNLDFGQALKQAEQAFTRQEQAPPGQPQLSEEADDERRIVEEWIKKDRRFKSDPEFFESILNIRYQHYARRLGAESYEELPQDAQDEVDELVHEERMQGNFGIPEPTKPGDLQLIPPGVPFRDPRNHGKLLIKR